MARKAALRAIVEMLRKDGFSGVTVLRRRGGLPAGRASIKRTKFSACPRPAHRPRGHRIPERIEKILPRLDEMVEGGLITLEKCA